MNDVVETRALAQQFETEAEDLLARRPPGRPQEPAGADVAAPLWPELAAAGWFGAVAAEAHGGLGLPRAVLGGLVRAAGRHLVPGPLLEHVLVAPALLPAAEGDSARQDLHAAVTGQARLALVDPAAGAPVADAPRLDDGGSLRGRVPLVLHAGRADVLAVVAGSDHGERVVLARRTAPGVLIEPRTPLTPTHEVADVVLDGARGDVLALTPAELADLRTWLRLLTAAWLAGVAERTLALTVAFCADRHQFGRPIGAFQAVQHLVADMTVDVATMVNLVSLSLSRSLDGDPGLSDEEALAAKAHAGQACRSVCESALQVHGGIGFTMDYPLHRYYKSALALASHYGEPEDLFLELGRRAFHRT